MEWFKLRTVVLTLEFKFLKYDLGLAKLTIGNLDKRAPGHEVGIVLQNPGQTRRGSCQVFILVLSFSNQALHFPTTATTFVICGAVA